MRTRLTEMLGIQHPIMLAGMGGVSYADLVVAVSEAGGFGCLGAATMTTEEMVQEIRSISDRTNRPFGVDLLTALPGDLVMQVEQLVAEGAKVFVAGLGVPDAVIELCHDHQVLVVNLCGKVDHARRAVDAGCDLVIAQGTEAGGHTGRVATMALVPAIVDAVGSTVPVAAAGGIVDGRGLAAALSLGADGVWVGSRFIATPEARAVQGFKDAIVHTQEDGTIITRAFTGKSMRAVANEYTTWWEEHPEELQPFPTQILRSMEDGAFHLGGDQHTQGVDPDKECYPAGQGVGSIHDLVPAARIVHDMVAEAEGVLRRLNSTWRALV
jgi:enoyl-[acyl-carrier protein] reductase II